MKEISIMSSMNIRFSEPVSAEKSPRPERGETSPPPCDKEAADLFMKTLEEGKNSRHDLESGGTKHEDSAPDADVPSPLSGMTNPLESLFAGRMEETAPAAPVSQMPDQAELEKLVERILVSTPEEGGHEVRISLGSHALPDTEITLHRNADGMLERLENGSVRVEVTQEGGREENDASRRSRTYMTEDQLSPK